MSPVELAVDAWYAFVLDLDLSPKSEEECRSFSLTWRREMIGQQWLQGFYHDTILNEALDATFGIAAVAKKFSRSEILSVLVRLSFQIVFKKETNARETLKRGLDALAAAREHPFDVFAPVNGIDFRNDNEVSVGAYSFLPANAANRIIVASCKSIPNISISADSVAKQDMVRVRVVAGDAARAREVAMFEFRWLEHAIKFFLKNDYCDFGITRFDQSRLENLFVLTSDGDMAHFASSVKGSMLALRIDDKLMSGSDLFHVLDNLGGSGGVKSDLRRRLKRAVYLGGLSMCETDASLAYFLCISAFEAIFQGQPKDYVSASISQQIVEIFCYLISDEGNRRKTFEEIKAFYGKRSAFAHGGEADVSWADVSSVRRYLKLAVMKFLKDEKLRSITRVEQIHELVRDIKFGPKFEEPTQA